MFEWNKNKINKFKQNLIENNNKVDEEYSNCTFTPRINNYKPPNCLNTRIGNIINRTEEFLKKKTEKIE